MSQNKEMTVLQDYFEGGYFEGGIFFLYNVILLLHYNKYVLFAPLRLTGFFRWQFSLSFLSSENHVSPDVLRLSVYDKLKDEVFFCVVKKSFSFLR